MLHISTVLSFCAFFMSRGNNPVGFRVVNGLSRIPFTNTVFILRQPGGGPIALRLVESKANAQCALWTTRAKPKQQHHKPRHRRHGPTGETATRRREHITTYAARMPPIPEIFYRRSEAHGQRPMKKAVIERLSGIRSPTILQKVNKCDFSGVCARALAPPEFVGLAIDYAAGSGRKQR